jgi:hypothetical protein
MPKLNVFCDQMQKAVSGTPAVVVGVPQNGHKIPQKSKLAFKPTAVTELLA